MTTKEHHTVDELLIYEAGDELSSARASHYFDTRNYPAWRVATVGVGDPAVVELVGNNFLNIQQLTICMPEIPGCMPEIFRSVRNLTAAGGGFNGIRRLMFLETYSLLANEAERSYERARDEFIIQSGRHFFAGKDGIVGISILPLAEKHSSKPAIGKYTLFQLNSQGEVLLRKTMTPVSRRCG